MLMSKNVNNDVSIDSPITSAVANSSHDLAFLDEVMSMQ